MKIVLTATLYSDIVTVFRSQESDWSCGCLKDLPVDRGIFDMDEQLFNNWTTQMRKGLLQLCVLKAMSGQRLYGYDIVRQLRRIEGLVISEGTIYPILSRFKRDRLVRTSLEESSEGPARKYYQLTSQGQKLLTRMNQTWQIIVQGVRNIQSAQPKGSN